MASRIIGRGDVVGLIERFEEVVDEEKAERDAVRMLTGKFDMKDFLEQIGVLKKIEVDDREVVRMSAMISSMTEDERRHPERFVVTSALYDLSRIARVARGSGREEQEVTDLLDRFTRMRKLMMQIGRSTGLLG
jgi:signal recognition particle subunit SRP54